MSGDHRAEDRFNNFLNNVPSIPISSNVPPPIPNGNANTRTPVAPIDSRAANLNNLLRSSRRIVSPPAQYNMTSAMNNGYGGLYNNSSFSPYNRPYMNMNMGGYNPYSTYGSPMPNQYQNPVVIAAAENSRPAFESIQSVVQTFNAVSMMLESTFTAMHMSFQALLGVAENFTRLRTFMMKLYSTAVSFRLARWFVTKLYYLLRMVRGNRKLTAEEKLWASLSTTAEEITPSDGRSWPLVVFTGLLVATPYFVYKLLNSVTPANNPILSVNNNNSSGSPTPPLALVFRAKNDWISSSPNTLPLITGAKYLTTTTRVELAPQNGGWLLIDSSQGQQGFIPLSICKTHAAPISTHAISPTVPNRPNRPNVARGQSIQPQTHSEQHVRIDPVVLPCPQENCDTLNTDLGEF